MKSRSWSIRSKIISLIAVPIAALVALWIFATTLTLGPALSLLNAGTLLDQVGRPGESLVAELQKERRLSLVYLAGTGDTVALGAQRARTDRAAADFRRMSAAADTGDAQAARLAKFKTDLDVLPSGRGFIDRREVDKAGALGLYTTMIDSALRAFGTLAVLPDDNLNHQAATLAALGRAREVLAQSDALIAGVFTAGRFGAGEHARFVQIVGTERYLYAQAVADLPDADRVAYQKLADGESFVRLAAMQNDLIGKATGQLPVNAGAWQQAYDEAQQQLRDFELRAADALSQRSVPVAVTILVRLGVAGVLGLIAVVVAVVLAIRVGRGFIRRLIGLRAAALELAGERLPDVVDRLRRGEEVDLSREAPPLVFGSDELGQVGHAFGEVQRTAVTSAVDEATLRRGLSEVFLNIARRSQTLLHRQLALLDRMERRTTDPDELADLFRVDHMATRMRRHAEDLVVLAGAAPGRGWRVPVPMIDVIRGAVSEVEDYPRVNVSSVETAAVLGRAVGDVIHLLAELIENATSFSPPHTRVHVSGQVVPNGYAVEVEDRGLGMTGEAIEEANRRLADPPVFDPANSARLGLFVVAQLGARHGVRVRVRSSPYGGVTAVALIPTALVVAGTGVLALPGPSGAEPDSDDAGRSLLASDSTATRGTMLVASPSDSLPGDGSAVWTVGRRGVDRDQTGAHAAPETTVRPESTFATGELLDGGVAGARHVASPPPERMPTTERPAWAGDTPLSGVAGWAEHTPAGGSPVAGGSASAAEPPPAGGSPLPGGSPLTPGSGSVGGSSLAGGAEGAAGTRPTGGSPSRDGSRRAGRRSARSKGDESADKPVARPLRRGPMAAEPDVAATPSANGSAQRDRPAWAASPTGSSETTPTPVPRQRRGGPPPARGVVVGADGLPRRIRQTNLAPQLRRPADGAGRPDDPSSSGAGAGPAAAPSTRSPEEIRARMSALQAGTARGRQEAAPDGGSRSADVDATTDPAPATEPVPSAESEPPAESGKDA
ncbi:MAG TPA: nitrate- and nitrite sensing domain-containing protein [Asanoa sp.]